MPPTKRRSRASSMIASAARLHQQAVAVALVGAQRRAQLLGHGDGDVEVRGRQHLGLGGVEPSLGLLGVAFGTAAVFAGVVGEHLGAALVAAPQVSAESLGAAGEDVGDGAAMRGGIAAPWADR